MKKFNAVSILLLLSLLAFTLIHLPSINHTNHAAEHKAVIMLDDTSSKVQWDDEKKQPFHPPLLFILTLILPITTFSLQYFSSNYYKGYFFLLPKFYQSNYMVSPSL
ncbi:hypothetical protein [Bacillus sp. JJ1764]|uniref:hypothetical protein n=1 Tax=Bacillus sp. JJ1764 TaxID=3122964 RepID=UPI002FFF10A0